MYIKTLLENKSGSNASEATVQLLKSLKVPVTSTTAIEQVETHPDFPSLYSISDSLKSWKIENAALHVETINLEKLPTPFIAHIRKAGGQFILVKGVNGTVDIINEKGKEEKVSRESFVNSWTNNVLLVEKGHYSGEKDYQKQKRKELIDSIRIPLLIGIGLLFTTLFAVANIGTATGIPSTLLLFVKLVGCIITGLLLWFEVDKANPVLQQICNGNENTNCTAVLSSKASRLFTWLTWSEVGFFYFAGTFIALTLSSASAFSLLSWLNLLALPYTFFSIYYQWRIAQYWCLLCLTVQALLLTEALVCYFGYWSESFSTIKFSKSELLALFTSFLLPILFWITAKKAFLSSQLGKQYKKELSKLKYNKDVFTALLQRQKAVTSSTEGLGILLGNQKARNTLIKICNPYCDPCAKAHMAINELLETNDDVKVQIIFTATNEEGDIRSPPIKHLMALNEKGDEPFMQKALDDWYNIDRKDYQAFKARYSLSEDVDLQGKKLEAMDTWCKTTGISFTPTIFVNGYQLPDAYKIEDLRYLL